MNGFSAAQAIISAMITPALLILASGSLIATALVRLARVVDRVRKLAETAVPAYLRRNYVVTNAGLCWPNALCGSIFSPSSVLL